MKNIYKNIYSDQHNLGNLNENLRIKVMLSMVDGLKFEGKNILDIGCYDGTFLSLIKNRNNNFFGIEASDWGFQESQKKRIAVQQYFFDDKTKLPFENEFFDIIIAGEIIEHIFDTDFFLEEVQRTLKPEGKLLLSTPNIASLGRRILLLLGKNPLIEISPNEPGSSGHIRYFTRKTLNKLLIKNKFRPLSMESDLVNFTNNGKIISRILAGIFPDFGQSIISLSEKKSD